MSQRDCGCPGLVTPTLDELLAVARQKPLPRVRVRERRPPPAKVGASLKGWLSWQLVDRAGREVRAGEGPNLILDQGLDQIATTSVVAAVDNTSPVLLATYFPLIRYAAVGTDNTSPATDQTGLGSELARTDATFATESLTRPSPGVYQLTRYIEFDYSVANGNLTEWGFSSSASVGSNLFNRALFLDGGGSPEAVTKTDEEKLRLTYTLEVTLSPVAFTSGSFDVTGVGTVNGDYMLIGGPAPPGEVTTSGMRCSAPDLKMFSALARGALGTVTGLPERPDMGALRAMDADQSGVSYTNDISYTSDSNDALVARETVERDAYTPGSFQRTGGAWVFDTAYANLDPIQAFAVFGGGETPQGGGVGTCARIGYVFDLNGGDVFTKDDEHKLTIGAPTVTWARAT